MKFVTELTPIFVTHSTFFSQTEMSHLCKCVINIVTRQHFYKVGQNPVSKEEISLKQFNCLKIKIIEPIIDLRPKPEQKTFRGFPEHS
jgi:hypothetical protein